MQERHIVVEGEISYCRSLFSESDNTLPVKLIHSSGVVLVFSASATLAQFWASIGECFMLTRGDYASMEHFKSQSQIFPLMYS